MPLAYAQVPTPRGNDPQPCPAIEGDCNHVDAIRCPAKYDERGCPTDYTCNPKFFLKYESDETDTSAMAHCLIVKCRPGEISWKTAIDRKPIPDAWSDDLHYMQDFCVSSSGVANLCMEAVAIWPSLCDKEAGEIWCNWGFAEDGCWMGSYCDTECQ